MRSVNHPTFTSDTCRWLTATAHATMTGSKRKPDAHQVTCCQCKEKVGYTESWVTVPFSHHGKPLPLPVFLHCDSCMLKLDATLAYMGAYQKDRKAGDPDPERVKREEQLNESTQWL